MAVRVTERTQAAPGSAHYFQWNVHQEPAFSEFLQFSSIFQNFLA